MFTGIIESLGRIQRVVPHAQGKQLTISCDLDLSQSRIGDSIAVNGACLTAVRLDKHLFTVDMAPETVSRTTFSQLAPGARVNIERALRLSDRIDGHLVSGHIDGTGTVASITKQSNAVIIRVEIPAALSLEIIEKGSVAVDGISLTVNACSDHDFLVSVIPHTAAVTTIGLKEIGDRVNIETDMIGKYVRKFLSKDGLKEKTGPGENQQGVSLALLAKNGFL